jgi:hypothetical protein
LASPAWVDPEREKGALEQARFGPCGEHQHIVLLHIIEGHFALEVRIQVAQAALWDEKALVPVAAGDERGPPARNEGVFMDRAAVTCGHHTGCTVEGT